MKTADCRSELAVLARRERLHAQGQAALTAHLAACADCRLTFRAGTAFDGGATLEPDDGMRIARMGIAARRWAEASGVRVEPVRRRPSRLRVALIAACWCLVAAVASGAVEILTKSRADEPPEAALARAVPSSSGFGSAPPALATLAIEPAPAAQQKPAQEPVRTERPTSVESAKVLFQRASAARRSGDTALARSLYQRLEREFPASSEAALSHLKLGSLLLDAADPAGALVEFDRYLAAPKGGALAPEALYGRGRALAPLGRIADERKTWARLLREFPTSPYAAHARRRLGGSALGSRGAP